MELEIKDLRILALDVGSVRIGLALWNPVSRLSECLPFLKRKSLKQDLQFLNTLVNEKEIQAFLVGLPIGLSGRRTKSTENAEFWIGTLKKSFQLPVYSYDESLSSRDALKLLSQKSRSKKQEMKDSLSAALFLEEFLREKA